MRILAKKYYRIILYSQFLLILLVSCKGFNPSLNNDVYKEYEIQSNNEYIYDIDNQPVVSFDSIDGKSIVSYYTLNSDMIINIATNIQYIGGRDSLISFFDRHYYDREDYNHREINETYYYSIYFDNNLIIKEIRIWKRRDYLNDYYDYDNLFKTILLLTEGNWIIVGNKNDIGYLYMGHLRLK